MMSTDRELSDDYSWAVMTEEGLTLWVNLTEKEAREVAEVPTARDNLQYAVPLHVAEAAARRYREVGERFERLKDAARREATRQVLESYAG